MAKEAGFVSLGGGLVQKSQEVVMARQPQGIGPLDHRLFNYLLHRAWRDLDQKVHQIPARDAMEYMRIDSPQRLDESLRNLGKANVEITYVQDGEPHSVVGHFLSYDLSKAEAGVLHYAFDPIIFPFLTNPKIYALFSLADARRFKSLYAARLYETMAMFKNRLHPVWEVSVDELKGFFGVEGRYDRPGNLLARVLEPAIEEINMVADFDVSMEKVRQGRGGKISHLKFTAATKSHRRLMEAREMLDPLGRTRKASRDDRTVDLLDGQTDDERGGAPDLRAETIEVARTMFREADVGDESAVAEIQSKWRTHMEGRRPSDPDRSFIGFVEAEIQRRQDEIFRNLEDDTFLGLLEEMH